MFKIIKQLTTYSAVIVYAFLLSGCNDNTTKNNTSFKETIKIAVAAPLTGPYASFGEQMLKGASQAISDINNNGGVDGKKLELVKADDACEPKQAVNVANWLIDDEQVAAVIGHFCSSSTIPASEIYSDAGVLMITPASTNPKVTDRKIPTIFRTCGRDDQQGLVAAEFIYNKLNAKRIAIIHDKDTYGQGIADAMKARLNQLGVQELLYEGLTRGEKDFVALATKIKSINPDAIYFGGLHTEAGPLVRQLREQGVDVPFISGDGIMSQDFVTSAGGVQFLKNVYMTFGADPRKIITGIKVVETFRKNGYEPEGYTLYSYATVQIIIDAIKKNKTTDGKVLSGYLKANSIDTIMGAKSWDNKGDLVKTDYVIYKWHTNGSYNQL